MRRRAWLFYTQRDGRVLPSLQNCIHSLFRTVADWKGVENIKQPSENLHRLFLTSQALLLFWGYMNGINTARV